MLEIDSPFTMVVLIVMIVFGAKIYMQSMKLKRDQEHFADDEDITSLRREVSDLRERVKTLERLATDKESALHREFSRL